MKSGFAAGLVALGFAAAAPADAAVVIEAMEVGSDTVFSFSGSFDVTGLTSSLSGNANTLVVPLSGAILFGGSTADAYAMPRLPAFGTSGNVFGSAVGDTFKIFSNDFVGFAPGYAGEAISGSLTVPNESFASLGLFAGTFTTSAANGSTVELRIDHAASVIPLPAARRCC